MSYIPLAMRPTLRSLKPSKHFINARLLRRLTHFHVSDHAYSLSDAHEQSHQVLRWISETAKSERQFLRMIREYTEHHKPLAYILGTQPFGPLEILVEPPILIPRPETEEWATLLADRLRAVKKLPLRILDLCSGSGCISLLPAHQLRDATVLGVDILPQAIQLATKNATKHDIRNASFEQMDIFDPEAQARLKKHGPFDCIVSNPPYIPRNEYDVLDKSVKDHESRLALLGEHKICNSGKVDGLDFYRRIREIYSGLLSEEREEAMPRLVMEVGKGQAEEVAAMFEKRGRKAVIEKDFAGICRSVWVYDQ